MGREAGKGSGSEMERRARQKSPAPQAPAAHALDPKTRTMTPRRWDERGHRHHPDLPEEPAVVSPLAIPGLRQTAEDGILWGGSCRRVTAPAQLPAAMPQPVPGTGTPEQGLREAAAPWQCHRSIPSRENKDTCVTRSVSPACAQARLSCLVPPQGTVPPSYFFQVAYPKPLQTGRAINSS